MSASELKRLVAKRVELMAKRELADAQHEEAVEAIGKEMLTVLESIATCVAETDVKLPPRKRAGPKSPPQPDHDRVAKQYADLEPAASGCLCGCGEHVADDVNFVRGHQKSLQSIARAVEAGKLDVSKMSDQGFDYAQSKEWISAMAVKAE